MPLRFKHAHLLTWIVALFVFVSTNTYAADTRAAPVKYKSVQIESDEAEPFTGAPSAYGQEVSAGLGIDYFNSFGLQGRYSYRLLPEGLIQNFNDAIYLEGGLGLTFYGTVKNHSGVTGFHLIADARWDLLYSSKITLFGTLGFGVNMVSDVDNADVSGGGFFPAVGVGAMYAFKPNLFGRFDLSYQFLGISVGYKF